MPVLLITVTLLFNTTLCIVEIPKMIEKKLFKELYVFGIFVFLGTLLAILKSVDVNIPNPSEWIAWIYSPVADVFKSMLE
ncbi:UNVERIFIED_CONTAM: hypothetical protein Cloal_3711 [Acetivibrio alkalicellulosi]